MLSWAITFFVIALIAAVLGLHVSVEAKKPKAKGA